MHGASKTTILLTPGLIALALIALGLTMAGCGNSTAGSSGVNGINGNWSADLTNADGSIAYRFTATFTQGPGGVLNVTNLQVVPDGPCLFTGEAAGGSFTSASGAFGLSMSEMNVGGPIASFQGTSGPGRISGAWTASGVLPQCSGNGTFTMQPSVIG